MIGGIGWLFGGPYAGLACFAIGALLILFGLTENARPRWRPAVFETIEKIHRALGIESTWLFVLIIALGFGCIATIAGGSVAWIVDRAYKRSPEYKADHPGPKSQTVATTASNSASQSVTVRDEASQGMQSTTTSQPVVKRKNVNQSNKSRSTVSAAHTPTDEELQEIVKRINEEYWNSGGKYWPPLEFINRRLREMGYPFSVKHKPGTLNIRNSRINGAAQYGVRVGGAETNIEGGTFTNNDLVVDNIDGKVTVTGPAVFDKNKTVIRNGATLPASAQPTPDCDYTVAITNGTSRNGAMPPVVPNSGSTLLSNNLVQAANPDSTAEITIEGKESAVTNNTIEGFSHATIRSTKDAEGAFIDKNVMRRNASGDSTQDGAGNGADMQKIREAQTANIYKPPCKGMGSPYPDSLPSKEDEPQK